MRPVDEKLEYAGDASDPVDAEVLDDGAETAVSTRVTKPADVSLMPVSPAEIERRRSIRLYVLLPIIFLTVALLGGLRLTATDSRFLFIVPSLVCFIFAAGAMAVFFRGGMLASDAWFSEERPTLWNIANGVVLASLFAATCQLFNSLIPEAGLPFWVVAFCFAWSLWNQLFSELEPRKMLRSLTALFAFAFIAKYVVLSGLTAPASDSGWLRSLIEDPAQTAATWLLDLSRYAAATGYIQFLCLALYVLGLYLLPRAPLRDRH